MSYVPKVYKKSGGDEMVVADGGIVTVEGGGEVRLTDTVTGTVYNITIENGILTPVEV